MIDASIFTNMTGAKINLDLLRLVANNAANINSVAFYGDHVNFAKLAENNQNDERTQSIPSLQKNYTNFTPGPIQYTGRDLDVAVDGPGFIAVQTKKGEEAFTRAGNLDITPQGLLVSGKGDLVLGNGGVINIPESAKISINKYGEIYARLPGNAANTTQLIGKIKLVTLPPEKISKGEDGLYHPMGNANVQTSSTLRLVPESLEGSNVDFIQTLVQLIDVSRTFDIHSKFMNKIDENAAKANQLLNT